MSMFKDIGENIINQTIGQGMGMLFGAQQDARQFKQQDKLNANQLKYNKQAAEHARELSMKTWRETNLPAQMAMADEAGLNPALLYGQGGAGGQTVGGNTSGVNGGNAGDPNAGVGMGMQMASQLALQKAQKENIEADTDNKKAQANTQGAQAENLVAQTALTNFQSKIAEIEGKIKESTRQDVEQEIAMNAQKAINENEIAFQKATISKATQQEQINQIRAEAVGATIKNDLMRAGIQVDNAKVKQIASEIQQKWRELELKGEANRINESNNDKMVEAIIQSAWIGAGSRVVGDVIGILTKTGGKQKNPFRTNEPRANQTPTLPNWTRPHQR